MFRHALLIGLPFVIAVSVAPSFNACGAIHYVAFSNATPFAPYASWDTAATNIQDAVDAAAAGDTVLVGAGEYKSGGLAVFGCMSNRVAIIKPMTVQSVSGPDLTVIEGQGPMGDGAVRCAYLTNGAVLAGFTLRNGCTRSSLGYEVETEAGGGAWCETGSVISNCTLIDNRAKGCGGGVYGSGTLNACSITGNSAYREGGGSYGCILNQCVVRGNSTFESGGGTASSTLYNCLICGNSAGSCGGGTYESTLLNCTVTGNRLTGWLWIPTTGTADCDNLLFSVIIIIGPQTGGAGAWGGTLTNCIISGNAGSNWGPYYRVMDHCCSSPLPPGEGNIEADPIFAGTNDFHLQVSSPCINSGINQAWMTAATDMDGQPRIGHGASRVDMGAYESFNFQDALDSPNLTWSSGGDTNWLPQASVFAERVSAAQSSPVGDSEETWLQTEVTSSGTLSFFWRVSCEPRYDTLTFYVDSEVHRSISGETGWQTVSVFVAPGTHTFRWTYRKGKSGASGADCGWVKQVTWTSGSPGTSWTLTVVSTNGCGTPMPDAGKHAFTNGSPVTARVTTPYAVIENQERRLCDGWRLTDILPSSGDGSEVTFTMTTDATLTWLWHTQYSLSASAQAGGFVNGWSDWFDAGSTINLTASDEPGWHFDHWSGDLDGTTIQGNSIEVPVDRARSIVANFLVLDIAEALDINRLTWATGGDAPWIPQTDTTSDSGDAAEACSLPDSGESWLRTAIVGPGTLTFLWRCDSEPDYDYLVLLVDGEVWTWLTGDTGWCSEQLDFEAGYHTLCWTYWKDENGSAGADAGWLDQVAWTGDLPTGFAAWAFTNGLYGKPEELLEQDANADGVANGFEYAFGANRAAGDRLINMFTVAGRPIVETPMQSDETTPYVEVSLIGSTSLTAAQDGWTLPIMPATHVENKPSSRMWYEPVGSPSNAFFRLRVDLRN